MVVHCEGMYSTNITFSGLVKERCRGVICLDTDQCPTTNVHKDSLKYGPEGNIILKLLHTSVSSWIQRTTCVTVYDNKIILNY